MHSISREPSTIHITLADGSRQQFDYVVIASHADQTLRLLTDADDVERKLLGTWSYSKNRAVLHTDSSVVHGPRQLWASWNYLRRQDSPHAPVTISYYMNRLQGLTTHHDYFVTLNPSSPISSSSIVYETDYEHPLYTPAAVAGQRLLRMRNGELRTFFCGAYLGYGFHEDGVCSALQTARAMEALA